MTTRYLNYVKNQSNEFKFSEFDAFNEDELEYKHDFIQFVFPLAEQSSCNSSAPVIDLPYLKQAVESDPIIRERFTHSVRKMLHFWGMNYAEDGTLSVSNARYLQKLNNRNHNTLRFSRMLRSMVYHGFPQESKKVLEYVLSLEQIKAGFDQRSGKTFWETNYNEAVEKMRYFETR